MSVRHQQDGGQQAAAAQAGGIPKELIQLHGHFEPTNTYTNIESKFRKNDITCEKCFHLRQRLQRKATQ